MLLKLVVPSIEGKPERVSINVVDFAVGDAVSPGARLVEFTTGLDYEMMHLCPPISIYRMTSSENAWVREVKTRNGEFVGSGEVVAILSTDPDEPLDAEAGRQMRCSVAAILNASAW